MVSDEYLEPEAAEEEFGGESDPENSYQVIAFDPGGTTGWAMMAVHPEAMSGDPDIHIFGPYGNLQFWTAGEFTGLQDNQIDEAMELIEVYPGARLVTESFRVRQLNALLDPAEINAVLRNRARPRYFVEQTPALAMSVTDDRLKAMGFWLPGKQHARDALRHAIIFLRRQKERAVREAERRAR